MADLKIALTKPVEREALTELALYPLHIQYHLTPDGKAGMVTIQPGELPQDIADYLLARCKENYEYVPPEPKPEPEPIGE